MKKILIYTLLAVLIVSCSAPAAMQVKVAPLGETVSESQELGSYVLPQTVIKLDLVFQETKSIPGPFREYAERYLGIKEVIRQNTSTWQILDLAMTPHQEADPQMAFQLHLVEGEYKGTSLQSLMEKGLIMDGSEIVNEGILSPEIGVSVSTDYIQFQDLGIESNFEEKNSTMYKTIITDTGFVDVPVNRTITEQKSIMVKAQEAADFILELRTRRFELLTGEYDAFPQGVAMQAALDKLDELETEYLSLFTGKTLVRKEKRSWFIVPEAGSESSSHELGVFSSQLGMVPEEMMEGDPLRLLLEPAGKTKGLRTFYSGKDLAAASNLLYYRIPDVVNFKLMLGAAELSGQRISVFQAGSLISTPL